MGDGALIGRERIDGTIGKTWIETSFGSVLVATSELGVFYVHLVAERAEQDLARFCDRRVQRTQWRDDVLGGVDVQQLCDFLAGERREFDLPIDLAGSEFQRSCWQELIQIPFGQTRTYGEMAIRLGKGRGASRAVGQANGANPVPVIVPCHRVLSSTGLGGYAGGLELKRRLLTLEGLTLPFE